MAVLTRAEQNDAVRGLIARLDDHCPGEKIHAERVAVYAVALAYQIGLRDQALVQIRWAAELHDIGKLSIPSSLLRSNDPRVEDLAEFRQHVLYAKFYLKEEFLQPCFRSIRLHHERWDGSGYPMRYRGSDIPVEAQVLAVAEWFDTAAHGSYWVGGCGDADALAQLPAEAFSSEVVAALKIVQPLIQPVRG